MRLKRNRIRRYIHKPAILKKDGEGGAYIEYGEPQMILAEMWPGAGKAQTEMYGMRLPNIKNLRLQGKYEEISGENGKLVFHICGGPAIAVNDGICICTDEIPDYKVIAIYPNRFLTLEVEKL